MVRPLGLSYSGARRRLTKRLACSNTRMGAQPSQKVILSSWAISSMTSRTKRLASVPAFAGDAWAQGSVP